jgi:hypothetical protein
MVAEEKNRDEHKEDMRHMEIKDRERWWWISRTTKFSIRFGQRKSFEKYDNYVRRQRSDLFQSSSHAGLNLLHL